MTRDYCGGCEGHGSHWRWCPEHVGMSAHRFGVMSEQAEDLGDRVGANETGAANHLYAAAGLLKKLAQERRDEYQAMSDR